LTGATGRITGAGRYWRGWLVLLGWLCPVLACVAQSVSLDINGVDGELSRNVERHVDQLGLTDRETVRRQRALILRSARRALEALGHYDSDIELNLSPPEQKRAELTLDIRVGEPVRWQDTRVTFSGPGMEDPLFQTVVQKYGPKVGDVLNHQHYETLKRELRVQALGSGYFDVVMQRQKLLIDRARRTAQIDLELATGPRYRFGTITFTPTRLNERALQRLIPDVRSEHLKSAPAGVRAQALGRDGKLLDDFLIQETERVVNVCNAPSPAATAALNIGNLIVDRLAVRFD